MAKLKPAQKVFRVKFSVVADVIVDDCTSVGGDNGEDEAYDKGYEAEYAIEEALRKAGFQREAAAVDSVTIAPKEAQNRRFP